MLHGAKFDQPDKMLDFTKGKGKRNKMLFYQF